MGQERLTNSGTSSSSSTEALPTASQLVPPEDSIPPANTTSPHTPSQEGNKMLHSAAHPAQYLPVHPAGGDHSHTGVTNPTTQSSFDSDSQDTTQLHHQSPTRPLTGFNCPEGVHFPDSWPASTIAEHSLEPMGEQAGCGANSPVTVPEQTGSSPGVQSEAKQGMGADADSLHALLSCPLTKVKPSDSLLLLTRFVKHGNVWIGGKQDCGQTLMLHVDYTMT